MTKVLRSAALLSVALAIVGCAARDKPLPELKPPVTPAAQAPQRTRLSTTTGIVFKPVSWKELPAWNEDNVAGAWSAFAASCRVLSAQTAWRGVCDSASRLQAPDADTARRFFENNFAPYRATSAENIDDGLLTGYYEPVLRGSRTASARYRFPVYGVPDDLLVLDAADVYPETKGVAVRGRLEGKRIVPYYDRAAIESSRARLRGKELAWVEDPVELFFLHVQGSGRIALENGGQMRVAFADHNGRPYQSIGRVLIERGALTADQASMQGIKAWVAANPGELRSLLDMNPRYVFFRELPSSADGPPGALGVPLTPRRSLAVDSRYIPLGAPVFVSTTWPNSNRPLNQLMFAQDTGGAIRGPLRGDFFWGSGDDAAREAGRMRERVRMWVLLPVDVSPPRAQ